MFVYVVGQILIRQRHFIFVKRLKLKLCGIFTSTSIIMNIKYSQNFNSETLIICVLFIMY